MTFRRLPTHRPGRTGSRRAVRGTAISLVLAASCTALVGVPASGATTTTQTATCTDRGGHVWKGRSIWGAVYTDGSGVRRIRNNSVSFTSAAPDATTVDYAVKTYNPDGRLIQIRGQQNRRYRFAGGSAYLTRNPRNPASGPGRSKIVVTVGDGNDGRRGCTMTFVQPGGATIGPIVTPTPPRAVQAFITGYTWWDNSPPGSAAIARPVLHRTAAGVGTYADPITMAVGFTRPAGKVILDIPAGTRFYLPEMRKYFIVEDICGACHRHSADVTYRLDIWLDGRSLPRSSARSCAYRITGNQPVVRNPPSGLAVRAGAVCA